jgi:tetratricopeptide (TPR) repeat protein
MVKKKKKSSNRLVGGVVLALFVLGGLSWYAYSYWNNSQANNHTDLPKTVKQQQDENVAAAEKKAQKNPTTDNKRQLAGTYAQAGMNDQAKEVYDGLSLDLGPTASPYDYLDEVNVYAKAGDTEKAKQALDKATQIANAITDPEEHDTALNNIDFYRETWKL